MKRVARTINWALVATTITFAAHGYAAASDLEDGQKAVERGDYSTALGRLLPLANGGNARAQCKVGRMYEAGEGVTKDYRQAADWYRKAGLQGDSHAQLLLALMYARGQGVPQDNNQGLYWLGKAIEKSDASKQQTMRMLYYQTLGTFDHGRPRSARELAAIAIPALQQQADAGDTHAQCAILQLYDTGQAKPRSRDDLSNMRRTCVKLGYGSSGRAPPPALSIPSPRPQN